MDNKAIIVLDAAPNTSESAVTNPKLTDWNKENTLCLWCGSRLHVMHVTHFAKNFTEESKVCPECGGKRAGQSHPLH